MTLQRSIREREEGQRHAASLFKEALYERSLPILRKSGTLEMHTGCVNHISFSENGQTLLSGSDDTRLGIWDVETRKLKSALRTGHHANIFCTRYMPSTGDAVVATCAGDSEVRVHDVSRSSATDIYRHHEDRVKKLITEPGNPNLIISAAEDSTVRQIDRRDPQHPCTLVAVMSRDAQRSWGRVRRLPVDLNSIDLPLSKPHLFAVGGSDTWLRMYDRRMTARNGEVKALAMFSPTVTDPRLANCDNVTGVACSADGRHVLGNYLNSHVYLFAIDGVGLGEAPAPAASPAASPQTARRGAAAHDAALPPASELPGIAVGARGPERPSRRVRIPARHYRHACAEQFCERAAALRSNGELGDALMYAGIAARIAPALGRAYYEMAAAQEAQGDHAAALASVQQAIELSWSQELESLYERLQAPIRAQQAAQQASQAAEAAARRDIVAVHHSAFADDESSGVQQQALGQQSAPTHSEAASGQGPSRSHSSALPPDQMPAQAGSSQAAKPATVESHAAGSTGAAVASAAQRQQTVPTSEAALQADHGTASPRGEPSSSEDLDENDPAPEPWHRARASDEDLARRRLRRRVFEGPLEIAAGIAAIHGDDAPQADLSEGSILVSMLSSSRSGSGEDESGGDSADSDLAGSAEGGHEGQEGVPRDLGPMDMEAFTMSSLHPMPQEGDDSADILDPDSDDESEDDDFLSWLLSGRGDGSDGENHDWDSAYQSDEEEAETARGLEVGRAFIDGEEPSAPATSDGGQGYVMRYRGHISRQTVKDVAFVGPGDCAVASGSDDGRMFIWNRRSGRLLTALHADIDVVNCVAGQPYEPLLASSGIDSNIKMWEPRPAGHNMKAQRRHLAMVAGTNESIMTAKGSQFLL